MFLGALQNATEKRGRSAGRVQQNTEQKFFGIRRAFDSSVWSEIVFFYNLQNSCTRLGVNVFIFAVDNFGNDKISLRV